MAPDDANAPKQREARLPGGNERLLLMVVFALVALFLTVRPDQSAVEPDAELMEAFRAAAVQETIDGSVPATVPVQTQTSVPDALASVDSPPETTAVNGAADAAVNEPADSEAVAGPDAGDAAGETPDDVTAEPDPVSDEDETSDADSEKDVSLVPGDDFEEDRGLWEPLTGEWSLEEGELVQGNPEGFDYINIYTNDIPEAFSVSVRMQAISDELGGGVILAQQTPGSRKGAYMVDFTSGGEFLRWGRYDPESGAYTYIGGLNVGTEAADPHSIKVEVKPDTTLVYLDETYIGAFEALETTGYVGLSTSQSSVAFDDFTIEEL